MTRVVKAASVVFVLVGLVVGGCASVPKESVLLSEELTSMIISARASHMAMVDEYMAEKRGAVDAFMQDKWIPAYLDTYVEMSGVLDDIDTAATRAEKGANMLQFSTAAQKEISNRRTTLMDALDEIENELRAKIDEHYTDMLAVNQALTAHLRSAAEVTATRDELITRIMGGRRDIIPLDAVNTAIETMMGYVDKAEQIPGVVDRLKGLISGGE